MVKKVLIWMLVLLSVVVMLIRYSSKVEALLFNIKQKGGITVLSSPLSATVFLDGKEVGKTPFEDKNLDVREYNVKIDGDGASWQGNVKLTSQTMVIVDRDLAKDPASSAGEVFTLDRGRGITAISNPRDSEVEVDGKIYGKTPVSINIDPGEHIISVSHPNYLKRSIKTFLPEGFSLTVSVDLALSEVDLTAVSAPVMTATEEAIVKETPTGFLRVRDQGLLSGKEITKVVPGDTLVLLEDQGSWTRVRLPDGTEGFVSSAYIEKKTP